MTRHGNRPSWANLIAAVLTSFVAANSALAQKGKPGGGGGGNTPPPPVQYSVVWLGTGPAGDSSVQAANHQGDIVGLASTFIDGSRVNIGMRFTPEGPVDLNLETADLLAGRDDGPWRVTMGLGINELGQITGGATRGNGRQAFLYDPGAGQEGDPGYRPRSLKIFDLFFDGSWTISSDINNLGQLAGSTALGRAFVYNPEVSDDLLDMGAIGSGGVYGSILNDAGQVAFATTRYTPAATFGDAGLLEQFSFHLYDINELGQVTGSLRTETRKGNSIKYTHFVYRAASTDTVETIYQGSTSAGGSRINDHGDVAFYLDNRLCLHRDGIGVIHIDQCVTDAKWLDAIGTYAMELLNPAVDEGFGAVGFPVIVGQANLAGSGDEAFVLIPVSSP